jgi:hypothetical protein
VVKATVPVAEAARAHFDAGADHLALKPLGHGPAPVADYQALSGAGVGRSGERATQRRRRVPRLAADDAAEVALIGEAEIGGQPREGALAAGQALERGADAQPHPVARERVTRGGAEDAAEVMSGDAEIGGQLGERAVRVGGQRLMRGVGEASPFADGGRPAGGDTPGIRLLQRRRGDQDRAFGELVGVLAAAPRGKQQRCSRSTAGELGMGSEESVGSPPQSDASGPGWSVMAVQSSPWSCGWS